VYLVRTRGEGLTILREWWEAQQAPWLEKRWAKALGDQVSVLALSTAVVLNHAAF